MKAVYEAIGRKKDAVEDAYAKVESFGTLNTINCFSRIKSSGRRSWLGSIGESIAAENTFFCRQSKTHDGKICAGTIQINCQNKRRKGPRTEGLISKNLA